MNAPKPIPVYDAGGRFVVGVVTGGMFCKTAKGSTHMLRQPPAWAFDVATLAAAERAGATEVQILDTESGTYYRAAVATVRREGFTFNRGHNPQIGLILAHWQTSKRERNNPQLALFDV